MLEEHHTYLRDERRLDCYRRALASVVKPGDRVLDLGAGTGILGLLALEAGAGHVYAVDDGPILDLARQAASAAGAAGRITHIRERSTRVALPERVDVVVADQIAPLGVGAGLHEAFADAARRHLVPGGRTIPGAVAVRVVPMDVGAAHAPVTFWSEPCAGLDFSAFGRAAASEPTPLAPTTGRPLGPGATLDEYDPTQPVLDSVGGRADLEVTTTGVLHALGGCFRARLADDVFMTNEPGHSEAIERPWSALPLLEPVAVDPGDRIEVDVRLLPVGGTVRWTVRVLGAGGVVKSDQALSTLDSLRFDARTLRGRAADHAPGLGRDGRAAARALGLLREGATVGALRETLAVEFADAWPVESDLELFVADLVDRFGGPGRADR